MASGPPTPDTPGDAGGLIVMVRPEPESAARAIADEMQAELAVGGRETEDAIARRVARHHGASDLEALAAAMRRARASVSRVVHKCPLMLSRQCGDPLSGFGRTWAAPRTRDGRPMRSR